MNIMEAIRTRHSVRQYKDRPLEASVKERLAQEIDACNRESGLHIQLITDEPEAFSGFMAHYGKFSGVTDYIAMIGKKRSDLEELCRTEGTMPGWFREGVEAAQLAPTAMNQQKFCFSLKDDEVTVTTKRGFYTKMDLGIVRYHFEAVTGRKTRRG